MTKNKIAVCGLDCSACAAFVATMNNDNNMKRKTAKKWNERYKKDGHNRQLLKPEDINCKGCLSDSVYLYCQQCEVRRCGLEKNIKNCKECNNYKCGKLINLQSRLF